MHLTSGAVSPRLERVAGRAKAAADKAHSAQLRAYVKNETTVAVATSAPLTGSAAVAERRTDTRVRMNDEVTVRRLGGFNFDVALRDLSAGGCRVEMLEPSEVGDSTVTRLPQLEPLGARVRWTEGTTTGLCFHTTIHPAVFAQLVSRMTAETESA